MNIEDLYHIYVYEVILADISNNFIFTTLNYSHSSVLEAKYDHDMER